MAERARGGGGKEGGRGRARRHNAADGIWAGGDPSPRPERIFAVSAACWRRDGGRRWSAVPHASTDTRILGTLVPPGATPPTFDAALAAELSKVDVFYTRAVRALQDSMAGVAARPRALGPLRAEAAALRRFAALNYVAAVKAVKKRNRRLALPADAGGGALAALAPHAFFSSPALAALMTEADVLQAEADLAAVDLGAAPPPPDADALSCAVCLGRLRGPCVLTCGHRFCWACATAAAGAAGARGNGGGGKCDDGEAVASSSPGSSPTTFWPCPTCRKPQAWVDGPVLEVDPHLERLLAATAPESPPESPPAPRSARHPAPLLPPKSPAAPPLTVVLDLDGTLIASFPPSRAGSLLAGAGRRAAYVVGVGSTLNPAGVCVVERPGLGEFLRGVSEIAEVVLFTAGLEDYARPIVDAIAARHGCPCPTLRLYRPATTAAAAYPCVKNLAALGRDPARTLLVDDTPLAFLGQPSSGVPVVPYRGGGDDGVLLDALLPLLKEIATAPDIRPELDARFGMAAWFAGQGLVAGEEALASAVEEGEPAATAPAVAAPRPPTPSTEDDSDADALPRPTPLAVFDFDHTLIDADIGEEVVGAVAPELAPQLGTLQMPACFLPLTNAVMAEAARRGVTAGDVVSAARRAGAAGLPGGGADALRAAAAAGASVHVLSDANMVVISAALAGAGLTAAVDRVTTNGAEWCAATGRLVVVPRHAATESPHGCPLCPSNLCKGRELGAIRAEAGNAATLAVRRRSVVYSGDGENDLCPALLLRRGDALLARAGRGLERLLRERAAAAAAPTPPRTPSRGLAPVLAACADAELEGALYGAAVYVWRDRETLAALVAALVGGEERA